MPEGMPGVALRSVSGPLTDLLVKLDSEDGSRWLEDLKRFLRGEPVVSEPIRGWREEDGVIYFSVTSDGRTGSQWIKSLEKGDFRVGDCAKRILLSPDFNPTSGITTEIAVLKGSLFQNRERVTSRIRDEGDRRKWIKPNAETACLIGVKFSDEKIEAMGLWWIIAMHEPIKDSGGDPSLLGVFRRDDGHRLNAYYGRPDGRWHRDDGFAFVVPQVFSFLSHFFERVLFNNLAQPPTEISADFI